MSTLTTPNAEYVSRVKDADGALCLDCGQRFDITTSPYWPWRNSQHMHERGTGHKTKMYRWLL